jgi:hypothetical protein
MVAFADFTYEASVSGFSLAGVAWRLVVRDLNSAAVHLL